MNNGLPGWYHSIASELYCADTMKMSPSNSENRWHVSSRDGVSIRCIKAMPIWSFTFEYAPVLILYRLVWRLSQRHASVDWPVLLKIQIKSAKSIDIEVSTKTAVRVPSILLSILLRKSKDYIASFASIACYIVFGKSIVDIDTTKVSSIDVGIDIRPAQYSARIKLLINVK